MPTPDKLATDAAVAIMLAEGFEEVEALAVTDVLYRAGVRADLISVTDARHVTSSHGIRVVADRMLEDTDLSTYELLFLPGGMPGTLGLKATPAIQEEVLRRADAIARRELANARKEREIWQFPVVLLADVRSVGVQGDGRTYGHPIVLRPVTSDDAMTADWAKLPWELLEKISTRITNECAEVNRVVLDITSKPPATIEWE